MIKLILGGLVALFFYLTPAQAQEQACFTPRDFLTTINTLESVAGETMTLMFTSPTGTTMLFFLNQETGSWTMFQMYPDRVCVAGAGMGGWRAQPIIPSEPVA